MSDATAEATPEEIRWLADRLVSYATTIEKGEAVENLGGFTEDLLEAAGLLRGGGWGPLRLKE